MSIADCSSLVVTIKGSALSPDAFRAALIGSESIGSTIATFKVLLSLKTGSTLYSLTILSGIILSTDSSTSKCPSSIVGICSC